ncbi:MAG TPA: rod shape-determining protein MreC [Caulobacteraceae bacterium]|nr:rod shape-determining protein MreC [Caulobacteraceae bacterium]
MSLREGPLGDIRVPLTWSAAAALIIAVIIAAALLLGGRRQVMKAQAYAGARHVVEAVAAPVGGVLEAPVRWTRQGLGEVGGYFFAVSENRRLKAELVQAQALRDRFDATRLENQRFRALLGVRTDPPLPMVFARTVSEARGPFSNTRLADVGADRGVTEGNPVLSEHGLVGRIVGVSAHVSRVLLLTDPESRTPVLIVRTNGRAILSGDGAPAPKLDYIAEASPLRAGDRILTSGDGGVFPRGLPVGTVVKGADGAWRVALDADASPVDDVQILLFTDFSQLVDEKALAPKDLPTAMTEEGNPSIIGPAAPKPAAAKPAARAGAATPPRPVRKTPAATLARPAARAAKPRAPARADRKAHAAPAKSTARPAAKPTARAHPARAPSGAAAGPPF